MLNDWIDEGLEDDEAWPFLFKWLGIKLTYVLILSYALIGDWEKFIELHRETPFDWMLLGFSHQSIPGILAYIFFAAASEELIFRLLPLSSIMQVTDARWAYIIVAVTASILFGLAHSGTVITVLLFQGLGGLLYSLIFIKICEEGERNFRAFIYCASIHCLFNLSLFIFSILLKSV